MDTEQQIRDAEQKKNSNETPTLAGNQGGDLESQGGGGIALPSLSRKQMVAVGVVVAVVVVLWWLKQRDEASGSDGLDAARESMDGTTEATVEDEDEGDVPIPVEHDPSNPLAADASVVKAFRDRGILSAGAE